MAQAVGPRCRCTSCRSAAGRAARAAAVDVGLGAVEDAVRAARRRALVADAAQRVAVRALDALLVVGARGAGPGAHEAGAAAVDVGLVPVLRAVGAAGRLARERRAAAHPVQAVGVDLARLAVGAGRAGAAAAVGVGLVAVDDAVGARGRHAVAVAVAGGAAVVGAGGALAGEGRAAEMAGGAARGRAGRARGRALAVLHAVDADAGAVAVLATVVRAGGVPRRPGCAATAGVAGGRHAGRGQRRAVGGRDATCARPRRCRSWWSWWSVVVRPCPCLPCPREDELLVLVRGGGASWSSSSHRPRC